MTPLQERCVGLHEYYVALLDAGFTRDEAMQYLIGSTRGRGSLNGR